MDKEIVIFENWFSQAKRAQGSNASPTEKADMITTLLKMASAIENPEIIEKCYDFFAMFVLRELQTVNVILENSVHDVMTAAMNAYRHKAFREAEGYFSILADSIPNAQLNLAYMIRRKEVLQPVNKYLSRALLLLRDNVEEGNATAIANTALILAVNLGQSADWELADKLFDRTDPERASDAANWWENINEPESRLVHLWLLRHKLIKASSFGDATELFEYAKLHYPDIPQWMGTKIS